MLHAARGTEPSPRALSVMRRHESALFALSDVLAFPSKNAMTSYTEKFQAQIDSKPPYFIPSGVTPPRTAASFPTASASPTILFVGRYVTHKGYDLFLRSAEELKARRSDIEFVTVGDGPLRRHSTAITDLGWTETPHDIIAGSSIVVIPNRVAYYDLLPLEVAAIGKPLVMTMVGGNIDQLQSLPDSIGVEPDNLTAGIEDAIDRLRSQPTWGSRNADAFRESFTDQHLATRWRSFIDSLRTPIENPNTAQFS